MRNLPNRWTRWATNPSATAVCSEGVPAKEEKDRAGMKQQSKGLKQRKRVKLGSQYDAGATSITSVMSVKGKSIFFTSQIASLTVKFSTI